ncbi:MAG TPA: hypothetical protein VJV78_41275 [Polyangiales bacterium]|nr:hypothetical protein [Polyangiales bacterium]
MSEDLLERATRALRELSTEPELHPGFTRERVLRSAATRGAASGGVGLGWVLAVAGAIAAAGVLRVAQHRPTRIADPAPRVETREERRAPATAPPPSAAAPAAAGGAAPAPATSPPEIVDELELFRRARSLHVSDDARALSAWDDYLRVAPHGRHAPEARYSRAVCLVRAGRIAEARTELEPFARGDYRGFRKREAQALLDSDALQH